MAFICLRSCRSGSYNPLLGSPLRNSPAHLIRSEASQRRGSIPAMPKDSWIATRSSSEIRCSCLIVKNRRKLRSGILNNLATPSAPSRRNLSICAMFIAVTGSFSLRILQYSSIWVFRLWSGYKIHWHTVPFGN